MFNLNNNLLNHLLNKKKASGAKERLGCSLYNWVSIIIYTVEAHIFVGLEYRCAPTVYMSKTFIIYRQISHRGATTKQN